MKVLSSLILAVAINAVGIGSASATVVFTDNFDSYSGAVPVIGTSFGDWNILDGTSVDIIGAGTSYDWFSGARGKYLDLDGSNGNGGYISTNIVFGPGTYVLQYSLAGSQREGYENNSVTVDFGTGYSQGYNLASLDAFQDYTVTVVLTASSALTFKNTGNDNVGALLDNVSVTAVPEPGTYAMMFAGLMMIGSMVVRKSKHSA